MATGFVLSTHTHLKQIVLVRFLFLRKICFKDMLHILDLKEETTEDYLSVCHNYLSFFHEKRFVIVLMMERVHR